MKAGPVTVAVFCWSSGVSLFFGAVERAIVERGMVVRYRGALLVASLLWPITLPLAVVIFNGLRWWRR